MIIHSFKTNAEIDKVIDTWKDVHFIFQNWKLFDEKLSPICGGIRKILRHISELFYNIWRQGVINPKHKMPELANAWDYFTKNFFEHVIGFSRPNMPEHIERLETLIAQIRRDRKLRKLFIDYYEKVINEVRFELTYLETILNEIKAGT